jgi:thioredoxin reductase
MSLEVFLVNGSETYHIAAAYALLEWAKDVAYVNHKEKLKKYEEVQKEEMLNTMLQMKISLVLLVIWRVSSQCLTRRS